MFKLLCRVLQVLYSGSRVIIEEEITEVGIYTTVSVLNFIIYFGDEFYWVPTGSIVRRVTGKYVVIKPDLRMYINRVYI